jgi:NADPH2:quinone reductase
MRAIGIRRFGGVDALEAMDLPKPEPGPGEVRVKVAFAGVKPTDAHVRAGAFVDNHASGRSFPFVLGYEGVGHVDAAGTGVDGLDAGRRVAWCGHGGSYAEFQIVPAWRLADIPEGLALDIACALQLDGLMAHALVTSAFPVRDGDRLLVQSGGGALAAMVVQSAVQRGADVIAVAHGASEAAALRRAGAGHVVVAADDQIVRELMLLSDGKGYDAVINCDGGKTLETSLRCARRRGVVLLPGGGRQPTAPLKPELLGASGSVYLTYVHLPDYLQDAHEIRWRTGEVFAAVEAGRLDVQIGRIMPLSAAREAHLALAAEVYGGTLLLKP